MRVLSCLLLCVTVYVLVWIPITESLCELAQGKEADYRKKYGGRSYWNAAKVVDGDTNTNVFCNSCVHTYPNKERSAWWQVNLNGSYAISRVVIYNREPYEPNDECLKTTVKKKISAGQYTEESDRLKGYSLHISTTTDHKNGTQCYKEPSGDGQYPELFQNVSCVGVGSHLTMYNDHKATYGILNGAAIVVCEIKVYGCPLGKYGDNCTSNCPEKCRNSYCYPETGVCSECQDGWRGDSCDDPCEDGKFGKNCSSSCPTNCKGPCDKVNGMCLSGCNPGFTGPKCNTECSNRTYGQNCTQKCGKCFNSDPCHHVTGICENGCDPGYTKQKCDTACDDGKYGNNCSNSCSANCKGPKTCDKVDGTCLSGCIPGFLGLKCNTTCKDGYYGDNCSMVCGKCLEEYCIFTNGSCPVGCEPGYQGDTCKQVCSDGKYGSGCSKTCGSCKDNATCDHVNGTCNAGCSAGWKGQKCNQECSNRTYGQNCTQKCGKCFNSDPCHHVTGICENGCDPGYTKQKCDTECESGTYGRQCGECGNCVNDTVCNYINGTCPAGCDLGYIGILCQKSCDDGKYGKDCTSSCSKNCKGQKTCDKVNGTCLSGCIAGFTGLRCESACNDGKYGKDCTSSCSENCKGQKTCDKVNGTCLSGCIAGFTGLRCESVPVSNTEESSGLGVGIGVAVGVLLFIFLVVIIFIIRRRHKARFQKSRTGDQDQANNFVNAGYVDHKDGGNPAVATASTSKKDRLLMLNNGDTDTDDDNKSIVESYIIGEDEQLYANKVMVATELTVSDIRMIVEQKKAEKALSGEYKALPRGLIHPHDASQLPENSPKNRYLTTLPYDHSIVKLSRLPGEPHSDYVNANYINGVGIPQAYVATQGPKSNTLNDFWRMIWERKSGKIVCVTRMKENQKVKCLQYWPNKLGENMKMKHLHLSKQSVQTYETFVIRNLVLKNTQTTETRNITQFHFLSWPDHGTPDPIRLVQFQQIVASAKSNLTGPVIVHCSAGIGRTGSFIALDALFAAGIQTGVIDVFRFTREMRDCRVNMIQTEDQYIMVHYALVEAFLLHGSSLQKDEFMDVFRILQNDDTPRNKNRCLSEFQQLQNVRPVIDAVSTKEATSVANKSKNRFLNVLPDRRYKPYLVSYAASRNEYINAVILPSFMSSVGYLVTQYPLPDTVSDFWCMVYDHDSSVIVILEPNQEDIGLFPDSDNVITSGTVRVTGSTAPSSAPHNGIQERQVYIQKEGDSHGRKVQIVEATSWPWRSSLPPSSDLMLDLIRKLQNYKASLEKGPVTVVCCDGALKCGLFCTIANTIEGYSKTNRINIMFSARQLQLRRPNFIPDADQYRHCFNVLSDFLEETSLYMNT